METPVTPESLLATCDLSFLQLSSTQTERVRHLATSLLSLEVLREYQKTRLMMAPLDIALRIPGAVSTAAIQEGAREVSLPPLLSSMLPVTVAANSAAPPETTPEVVGPPADALPSLKATWVGHPYYTQKFKEFISKQYVETPNPQMPVSDLLHAFANQEKLKITTKWCPSYSSLFQQQGLKASKQGLIWYAHLTCRKA